MDGKLDEQDLELLQQYLMNETTLTETQKILADVNEDGKINSGDIFLLKKMIEDKK